MNAKLIIRNFFLAGICIISVASCSKSSATKSASINGSWYTPTWGAMGDTAIININTSAGTGTITYLNNPALTATGFSVNEVIFSSITSTGGGSYTAVGEYRYGTGGKTVGHATATIQPQNNNSVLYVHYSEDLSSGITPPDYYWQKQ